MISFYLFWLLIYVPFLWVLARKWSSKNENHPGLPEESEISLIIPFRNESENAPALLRQLVKTESTLNEILLINDHSEDGSREILANLMQENEKVKIWDSPGIGKKAAVEFGIKQAKGSIVVVSDADCTFSDTWVTELLGPFTDHKIQLVAGPVLSQLESRGFLDRFQQIEWASILLLPHYFFQTQKPLMCSAANLAYRRSAFIEVGGYTGNSTIASGDDEFLLKKIVKKYGPASCRYQADQKALVWTRPQKDLFALLHQRMRWAGKWKQHSSLSHLMTSVVFAAFQGVWISSICIPFFGGSYLLLFLGIWGVKISAETMILAKVLRSFGVVEPVKSYVKTSFFHPFYVILTVAGIFFGNYVWKGRSN